MTIKFGLALGAFVCLCPPLACAAELGGLSGAWATSAGDCEKLFVHSGRGYAFRQPVDKFAQAAIISPGSIVLPSQTCRVTHAATSAGVTAFSFECRDSISYTSQSIDIEIKSPTELVYRPNGDKTLDTTFVKCR